MNITNKNVRKAWTTFEELGNRSLDYATCK